MFKRKLMYLAIPTILALFCVGLATEISGPLTDTLHFSSSPYEIVGDIFIPSGSSLVIEPGVVMNFQGAYSFHVNNGAVLSAIGTEPDSIIFTCDTLLVPGGWGGIFFDTSGSGCILQYCRVEFAEFGAIVGYRTNAAIRNCHITHNWSVYTGLPEIAEGITFLYNSHPTIEYNLIDDNFWAHTFGIIIDNSSAEIIGNTIAHHIGYIGLNVYHCYDVIIENNIISDNQGDDGVAMRIIMCDNVTIEGNLVTRNTGLYSAEIITVNSSNRIFFNNNILTYNHALESQLPPLFIFGYCDAVSIVGNMVAGNQAKKSPGIGVFETTLGKFANNVFVNNTSLWNMAPVAGIPKADNCIFWNNSGSLQDSGFYYCDIQGGHPGEGNIDIDPIFRDTTSGDYHLMSIACGDPFDSPCIDAGSPLYYDDSLSCNWGLGTTLCDMGAHGGVSSYCIYDAGDVNGDGSANGIDVVYFVNYLKGGPEPVIYCNCANQPYFYAAADVNGNCVANGIDITFFVRYLKGQVPSLLSCPDCPPGR